MEPVTLLLGLAAIVGTGALTKVGENITDRVSPKVQELFTLIQRKLPQSQTLKSLAAGQDIDYQQAMIDLEPIAQDPEVSRLLAEVRSLIAQNRELQAKLDAAMAKVPTKNIQVNRDRAQGYQFNEKVESKFLGGIHYHGTDPD